MSSETPQLPLILDPATLAQHLEDPHLLIIDVPLKAESYESGHVPGAIFLESRRLLAGTGEVPNDVPSEAALSALFSELGLTPFGRAVPSRCAIAGSSCFTQACSGGAKLM